MYNLFRCSDGLLLCERGREEARFGLKFSLYWLSSLLLTPCYKRYLSIMTEETRITIGFFSLKPQSCCAAYYKNSIIKKEFFDLPLQPIFYSSHPSDLFNEKKLLPPYSRSYPNSEARGQKPCFRSLFSQNALSSQYSLPTHPERSGFSGKRRNSCTTSVARGKDCFGMPFGG